MAPGLAFSDTLPRVAAWFIDGLLLTLIGAVIGSILGVGTAVTTTFDSPTSQVDYNELFFANELTIVGLAVSALYFIGSWSGGRRATLGQRLLKIQVGNAFDGRPLTLDQAIRRWLGFGEFIWLIGFVPGLAGASSLYFLWALVLLITTAASPTKQGLHDRLANSAVVRPVNAGNGLAIGCVVILLILLAIPLLQHRRPHLPRIAGELDPVRSRRVRSDQRPSPPSTPPKSMAWSTWMPPRSGRPPTRSPT